MRGAAAQVRTEPTRSSDALFAAVGRFLTANRLGADPANYAFAHAVVSDPTSMLSAAVARLTDGGVRLTARDVSALGGSITAGVPMTAPDDADVAADPGHELIERASDQVASFASMVRAMHDETRGFGDDLAQRAAAMRHVGDADVLAEIARITGAMLHRIRESEARLCAATNEAEALRSALAEARTTARIDALTGLPNRRALDEALAEPSPVQRWLAMCDIDHFKRINDGFGHVVGDRVLGAIAGALAGAFGEHLVVRYGGEEFAVLITGGDQAAALTLIDDARTAVSTKRFRSRDTGQLLGAVTFSAGLIGVAPGEAGVQALERADRLLYAAKAQGRDRVVAE